MMLVFPSMLVLRTRRMCWKFGGTTSDILKLSRDFYLKQKDWDVNLAQSKIIIEAGKLDTKVRNVYSFSSDLILALGLVTLMASWAALSIKVFLKILSKIKLLILQGRVSNFYRFWKLVDSVHTCTLQIAHAW